MCYLSTGLHRKSNISLSQSRSIISTITSHSNDVAELSQACYHDVFVIWSGSSQYLQFLSNLFHIVNVSNSFSIFIFSHD